MNLPALQQRALEIRQRYDSVNAVAGHKKWGAAEYTQGFVGDVGDLVELVMAKEGLRKGADVDARLEHELADCLWSILVIAHELEIDLEQSFTQTMTELEQRLESN